MNMLNEDVLREMMAERARQAKERRLRSAATRRTQRDRARSSASLPNKIALTLVMTAGVAAGLMNLVHSAPVYAPNVGPSWLALTGGIAAIVTLVVAPTVQTRLIGLVSATILLLPTGGILLVVHGLSIFGVIPSPVDPVSLAISAAAAASCLIAMWTAPKRALRGNGGNKTGKTGKITSNNVQIR